jgi:hypothetical protein
MRVMVIVKATKESEAGKLPAEQMLKDMGDFNEELVRHGIMLAGEGLHPSSKGRRIRFSKGNKTVTNGPFPQTEELVAGFWIWDVKSMDEAIEWAKKIPDPMGPGQEAVIEIRPVMELEDMGATATPELKAQNERLRAEVASRR